MYEYSDSFKHINESEKIRKEILQLIKIEPDSSKLIYLLNNHVPIVDYTGIRTEIREQIYKILKSTKTV